MTTPTRWFKSSSSSRNGSSINNLMPLMDSYVSYFYVFIILRNNCVIIASTWIPCSFIETVFTPLSIINIFNANRCSLITNDTNQHSWIGVAFNKSLRSMELIYEITEFQIEIFWGLIFFTTQFIFLNFRSGMFSGHCPSLEHGPDKCKITGMTLYYLELPAYNKN